MDFRQSFIKSQNLYKYSITHITKFREKSELMILSGKEFNRESFKEK
jgi:hypothetical protein